MKLSWKSALLSILLFSFIIWGCQRKAEISESAEKTSVEREPPGTITLHYHERPPYSFTTDEGVKGILIEPVEAAFKRAGIAYVWNKTPSSRQLKIIQDNRGRDGILGWFRNPEREKFGLFSQYIYQDSPYIAICRADNEKIGLSISVDELLSNKELLLDVKIGYSYGWFLDEKIDSFHPERDMVTTENLQILQKIHLGRGDYFFIAPEEADILIEESGLPRSDFRYISFPEMPPGEKRYIIFSFNVKSEEVARLSLELGKIITP